MLNNCFYTETPDYMVSHNGRKKDKGEDQIK